MKDEKQWSTLYFPGGICAHGHFNYADYKKLWKQFTGKELKYIEVGWDENGNPLFRKEEDECD